MKIKYDINPQFKKDKKTEAIDRWLMEIYTKSAPEKIFILKGSKVAKVIEQVRRGTPDKIEGQLDSIEHTRCLCTVTPYKLTILKSGTSMFCNNQGIKILALD